MSAEASRQLVISNLRFVVYIARGHNYKLQLDLIQEANIGRMKASDKRFNPRPKVRLISFAVHWIKAEIYLAKLDHVVFGRPCPAGKEES